MKNQEGALSDEQQAIEHYNQGLKAKYAGLWEESLRANERAQALQPGDEATLWNLAIAATALRVWDRARFAWRALGIEVMEEQGEVHTRKTWACVRLRPNEVGEVVWGTRIDPARIQVENVPLPASERRYHDVILNDGAPEGQRIANGVEYPVFDELHLWRASPYSTYEASVLVPDEEAAETLERLCTERDIALENWATVRKLCAACSRGTPGEHDCTEDAGTEHRYGFGTRSEEMLRTALTLWAELHHGAEFADLTLVVAGSTQ